MSQRILGIDPGSVSAAYACLCDGRFIEAADAPVADRQVNATEWASVVKRLRPDLAIIELVGAMPKQGSTSGFRFGMGVGLLRGVVMALGVPLVQVVPGKWKLHYRLTGKPKDAAREIAIRLFPEAGPHLNLVKHHGRADALLLAKYAIDMDTGAKFA